MTMENLRSTENNILIANFLGYTLIDERVAVPFELCESFNMDEIADTHYTEFEDPELPNYWLCFYDDLPFESSMDWILLAVDKIESMGYHTSIMKLDTMGLYSILIKNNIDRDFDYDYANTNRQKRIAANNRVTAVYNGVVDFINWYNEITDIKIKTQGDWYNKI